MALGFSAVFVALSLWLLPRLKGIFVGLQWAKRMHGFGDEAELLPAPEAAGPPVRDAATVILVRRTAGRAAGADGPARQRRRLHARQVRLPRRRGRPRGRPLPGDPPLEPLTARRLAIDAAPALVRRSAARRGPRALGGDRADARPARRRRRRARRCRRPGRISTPRGSLPNGAALRFVFRAVTPPGRPRRFDARFFLAEATRHRRRRPRGLGRRARHLQWLDLAGARALPLPFITEVVLSELEALLADDPDRPVPFFHQTPEGPRFRLL